MKADLEDRTTDKATDKATDRLKNKLHECINRMIIDTKKYGLICILIVTLYFIMHKIFNAFCPVVIVTGFPCPGCGTVRAIALLLSGHFERSFLLNPLAGGWLLLGAWIFIRRYLQGKKITGLKQTGLVLIIGMMLVYGYKMYFQFPGRPPMTFRYQNLIGAIFTQYNDFVKNLF